jgi:hypothetical protein
MDHSCTKAFSKIMCVEEVFPLHIIFAYLIMISGIGAFITRIRWTYLHSWFGISFIIFMLWCTGTSLLIFTTGLPRFVIASFVIMGIALTIGIYAIKIHKIQYQKMLNQQIDQMETVNNRLNAAIKQIEENPRSWQKRLFSWKALHGYCMAIAWYQIAGRLFVTNPFKDWHGCFTYPAYKELDENGHLVPLPEHDPDFSINNEALFIVSIVVPMLFVFAIIGIVWSIIASKKNQ